MRTVKHTVNNITESLHSLIEISKSIYSSERIIIPWHDDSILESLKP